MLLISIFIIITLLIYMYPNYIELSSICYGDIAVVGNGPINQEDRNLINTHDCVIRFNDQKNKLEHEKTDVLVLRNNTLHLSNAASTVLPVLPFCKNIYEYSVNYSKMIRPIYVYEDMCSTDSNVEEWRSKKVFENCIKNSRHADSSSGVSTGTALLSFLQSDDSVTSVNVFGMNFNGGWWHLDFNDPNLTNVCCTKCNFHRTRVNEYK